MTYQPFLIADYRVGLDTNLEPWLLPSGAFQQIEDAYLKFGVINKRPGYGFFGQLVSYQTTVTNITNANPGRVTLASAVGLANGQEIQISYALGMTEVNGITYVIANLVGASFDLTDLDGNNVNTSGFGVYAGSGVLSIFPGLPVMGIRTFINSNNEKILLAFDTRRGSIYNPITDAFDPLDTADIFTRDESSFVGSVVFGKTNSFLNTTFFFTNFNGDTSSSADPMRKYVSGNTTSTFIPDVQPVAPATPTYVNAAQFIFTLRQRLLLLGTIEGTTSGIGGTHFAQRMRWSRAGNPDDSGSNWDQITPGNGGFVDAPTGDQIIGAKPLQETIIVFFTQSVWIIRPTSDPALPFRWDKLNDFRSCDAPFSTLGYDRYIISYGKRGIVACDGIEVKRIDDLIEPFMDTEVRKDFINRMYSERNFVAKRSWTLYASTEDSNTANPISDKALIRTDEEFSWSIFNVPFTCLGYGESSSDLTWNDFPDVNTPAGNPKDLPVRWKDAGDLTWSSFAVQIDAELFLAGDAIGKIYQIDDNAFGDDDGASIPFLVRSASWNPFKEQGKKAQMGYMDIYIDVDENALMQCEFFSDDMETPYSTQMVNFLPDLGFVAEIQNITQANPAIVTADGAGVLTGQEVYIYAVQGMVEISGGPYTVTAIDSDTFSLDGLDSTGFTAYTGYGQVVDRQLNAVRAWKRIQAGGVGYEHQIRLTHEGIDQPIRIHAFCPWFRPISYRMIG